MANGPLKTIPIGNGIRAKIWENESNSGRKWLSVEIIRTYKDGENFKDTTSFRQEDLLFVAKAADAAFNWCFRRENGERTRSPSA